MAEEEALTEQISPDPAPASASASPSARDVIDVDLWLLPHTPPGFNDRGMDLQRDATELPTIESNAEPTESSQFVSPHRERRAFLDLKTPRNKQIMSDNNMASCESSSRFVVPYIAVDLKPIAMSSKDCKTNVIEPRGDMARGLDTAVRIGPPGTTLKETNPSSPENKRSKFESGKTESFTLCNCKKTKCLKLYCECFAAGAYCLKTCSCIDCFNKLIHGDVVMATRKQIQSWNPLAFASKITRSSGSVPETESYKRCNCIKSKCMKLYCDCFAAGAYCLETCSCIDCFNKLVHEDVLVATRKQIESRDPLAFAPKVIRSSDSVPETGDDASKTKTPASARYKRGCHCQKSKCLKKYCECYQGGVGCSRNCRCEECKNTFGRRDERFFHSL